MSNSNAFKRLRIAMLILIQCTKAYAQPPLKIGDTIPDFVYNNVINSVSTSIKLSDVKKKMILLDLWGTGCASCIQAFPELERLNKKFSAEMTLILANKESRDSTINFFQKRKKIIPPSVPIITDAKTLYNVFPANFQPVQVWIDSNLIVRHITYATFLNEENIQKFISGIPFESIVLDFTNDVPFAESSGKDNNLTLSQYYSTWSKTEPGMRNLTNTFSTRRNGILDRIVMRGATPLGMIKYAIGKGDMEIFYARNQIALEVSDTSIYLPPSGKIERRWWSSKNAHNYELQVPEAKSNEIYNKMAVDISFLLGVNFKVERRKIDVIALKYLSGNNSTSFATKGGLPFNTFNKDVEEDTIMLVNKNFSVLSNTILILFRHLNMPIPYVDEVKFKGNIDIVLSKQSLKKLDIPSLNIELSKYNLRLVRTQRVMDVLVIKE